MKTAVLLIIGAAVIGPIEAERIPDEECRAGAVKTQPPCYREPVSVEYLCARAMKEIGARHIAIYSEPIGPGTVQEFRGGNPREDFWVMPGEKRTPASPLDWPRVRCIPVPEGYRR